MLGREGERRSGEEGGEGEGEGKQNRAKKMMSYIVLQFQFGSAVE